MLLCCHFPLRMWCAVLLRLLELGQPGLHPLFVKQVVTLAMDRRDREREMASGLLSELHPSVISDDQVWLGGPAGSLL